MWQHRSHALEIIDLGPAHYTSQEYKHCLTVLFRLNRLLGFFSNTKKFLQSVSPHSTILDVGCGSGLFLLHLSNYFPAMKLMGIDTSSDAISEAKSNLQKTYLPDNACITFQKVTPEWKILPDSVDVVMATLVCHHLTDEQLITFFQSALHSAKKGVIIHDLHRSRIAYVLYKMISPLFRNRLITHDGLLSIKRGFKYNELMTLLKKAGIKKYEISWRFPFCWRIVLWKN